MPTVRPDPSSRGGASRKTLSPPIILTQTMDVMLGDFGVLTGLLTSQSRVLDTDPKPVWTALVSMGRPLWRSMELGNTLEGKQRALTKFAASKLLLGLELNDARSYDDSTLHGMSSLFCRVGLRPRASDSMATRFVADFMSVLHYVTYKCDAHSSSYTSDPILTIGASRMWYQLEPPALESHILRQFQAVLLNGVVDTGHVGEIVARIFLLLAMDATLMSASVDEEEFVFSGQFGEVPSFVAMLVGNRPEVCTEAGVSGERKAYDEWLQRWKD
ncbi:hypothetical protein PHYPSEUDO_010974 [Phytophthora pseudosyringae]|uniref:Uncharacterized protein n=1 Tax=Phytophthora pseudosyringae TaxID=221518 RepID=A0A8T1W5F6_9STRA|nr:hypothetical protein PHYPSEUDO_010974 [Phytophthora pseudosyringae]